MKTVTMTLQLRDTASHKYMELDSANNPNEQESPRGSGEEQPTIIQELESQGLGELGGSGKGCLQRLWFRDKGRQNVYIWLKGWGDK